ncbi:actin-binding Rho-activating protein-like [Mercenaria mercenaria]|uniref:actin-binding Rho-activating protein-like n=1 Tax=Mercenaria mercenaria TaxID=6596 RepID=UPI00234E5C00|nr:actin-binding Rho-activating protein-like [Mercenaria mercenaria]
MIKSQSDASFFKNGSGDEDIPSGISTPERPPKVRNGMVDRDGMRKNWSFWQQRIDNHQIDRLINPFSEFWGENRDKYIDVLQNSRAVWKGADKRTKLTKADDKYGRPVEGTLTEYRGNKAKNFIANNIVECCDTIRTCGVQKADGTWEVKFGILFKAYERINDKLVGLLVRARRHGLLDFPGEMLYQRQDDDVIIKLYKVPTVDELNLRYIDFQKEREELNSEKDSAQ